MPTHRGHYTTTILYCHSRYLCRVSLSKKTMILEVSISILFCALALVENSIDLHNTGDGLALESFDCVRAESSLSTVVDRENRSISIATMTLSRASRMAGQLHASVNFNRRTLPAALYCVSGKSISNESKNILSTSKKMVAKPMDRSVNALIQPHLERTASISYPSVRHLKRHSTGKLSMRERNPQKVQIYGDVICLRGL